MRILIVGAGIAGPTLAHWLRRSGHEVTLVEQAPAPRAGGYLIDFWGAGFEVAERMGLVPRLLERGYQFREVREVLASGRTFAHFDPRPAIEGTDGRYVTIARADLAAAILDSLDGVETIFGDTVDALDDDGTRVRVRFASGSEREFDLVVGADGLHSRVRSLAFAPGEVEIRDPGIAVAVFDVEGYRPRDELVAVTRTQVGLQSLRVAMHDDGTMFCFTFRHDGQVHQLEEAGQRSLLRERLAGVGWEVPAILERLPDARSFYLDRAAQVLLPEWSRGRVALVGDAAACPSLLAGQGSALAMVEAYWLATALHAHPSDTSAALRAWHAQLAKVVRDKQDAAVGMGVAFAPKNRAQLVLRDAVLRLMGLPFVARRALRGSLRDPVELPPAPVASARAAGPRRSASG
ncbi:MAG: FAD-binding domain [Actinomycetales bacterium]|nr:FAD-binding domain [Actinomycetales bacterium]